MFKHLFEYYNLSNYDTRPGAGISMTPNKSLGKTVGDEIQRGDIYDKFQEGEELDDVDVDEESLEAIGKKLHQPVYAIDKKRSDLSNTSGSRRMGPGLNETESHYDYHTSPVRTNNIAPYKHRKFNGPPIGAGNASNIYRTGPGRKTGTVYGFSRAPIDVEFNDPLFFGGSVKDKMEISFLKQQKKINRIKRLMKQIENSQKK